MAGSRTSLRAVVAGILLAAVTLLLGPVGHAAATPPAPYPPAPAEYSPGSISVNGETITACGPAGATDPGTGYVIAVDGVTVATGVTNGDGSYCTTASVPAGLAPGTHQATFTSAKSGGSFTLSTSFERADTPKGTTLPRTGSDTGATVQLAVALMAAGAVLLTVVGLRRRNVKA